MLSLRVAVAACLLAVGSWATTACDLEDDPSSDDGTGGEGTGGASGGAGAGGPAGPNTLTVMNWNVENFYNDQNDSPASVDEEILSSADYNAKLTVVSSVIDGYDPDIVVFAEVENTAVLDDLNEALGGEYIERVILDGNDPRGLDIAIMSKITLDDTRSHASESFALAGSPGINYQMARDCPEYELTWQGGRLILFGAHFRSKGPPDDADKRLAEAQFTRNLANARETQDPAVGIIILGDFNDTPGSPPVEAVRGSADGEYENAPELVPNAASFNFQGSLELIDHQMSNSVMSAYLDEASVIVAPISPAASDHAPIIVTYRAPTTP